MNCKKIRSRFYDYADDTVDQATRFSIESHLSGCALCHRYYEEQRRMHRSIANAVAHELGDLHFKPMQLKAEPASPNRSLSRGVWIRRMAFAIPCLLIFSAALWLLRTPPPEIAGDAIPSAHAEAIYYLETHSSENFNAHNFSTPRAVIMQPGAPVRTIVLDGTTDISTEVK